MKINIYFKIKTKTTIKEIIKQINIENILVFRV